MARRTLLMHLGNSKGLCQGIRIGSAFSCYHREETGRVTHQEIKCVNGLELKRSIDFAYCSCLQAPNDDTLDDSDTIHYFQIVRMA